MSIRKKFIIIFIFTIITSLVIVSTISNLMISNRFNTYLESEHKSKVENIAKTIEKLFIEDRGFSNEDIQEISLYAVLENVYIEIKDINNNLIFSSGKGQMLKHRKAMKGMMRHKAGRKSPMNNYVEKSFSLLNENNNEVGKITIGYYGTSYFSERSITFKNTLNKSFLFSTLISLILSLLISLFLSKEFSEPLIEIAQTSNEMRKGNLNVRTNVKTDTKEIKELSNSINYLAETLQKQESLRKKFTADIAHELRTPLTNLQTHIEAFIDGIWEPSKKNLENILDEINRLAKLINNLREISKLEETGLNLNKTAFNISEEIKTIVQSFKPVFMKNKYEIESDIEEDIKVLMDKDKIRQVMYNLISNSHKYLKSNGKVYVSLKEKDENIKIQVIDNGIGIKKEEIPYIFERFYRSDVSRNRETGGSGIGLTIAKSIVEAHGGTISVQSNFNNGTTFTITLPKK